MQASDLSAPSPEPGTAVGLHLQQTLGDAGFRKSAVAIVSGDGRLVSVAPADGDGELAALVPQDAVLIVVDAPLVVPNAEGRRDLERLLEWSDVPVFPASTARLTKLHGGLRGPRLAATLGSDAPLAETPPDLMLRQLAWERESAGATPDLAEYRARFLAVRPPRYRPRGRGRADPAGADAAAGLLADALELGGWRPERAPDDRGAILDAARLDAVAAAAVAHRALRHPGSSITLRSEIEGPYVLPADDAFRRRLAVNLERLRAEGRVSLLEMPPTRPAERH